VGRRVLALEVEPLGNVTKGASDEASEDLGVFRSRLPDRGIHRESAAF
jgi:hypothetical protein